MNIETLREQFPILDRQVYNRRLVYLDNAATTQKPRCVLEAMDNEYRNVNANVHRGAHYLSQQATGLHEAARETVRAFINAHSTSEVVFTRGTTESINLIASSFKKYLGEIQNPTILVGGWEHHSNIVPWQLNGFKLIPFWSEEEYAKLIENESIVMVSVAHVSNVLGTLSPIRYIIDRAHERNIPVLLDAAQSVPHMPIDVQELDCDFFAFSGHKMYGPTGVGVLYGKLEWLEKLPPYQGGGEMISHVSFENTTFEQPPLKFEAGTPDYIATHGLATAIDFLNSIGMDKIHAYEQELYAYMHERLLEIEGITLYGSMSFNIKGIHHMDLGTLLDRLGVAVRTGHHCAEPLMDHLGVLGTVRASLALYNTREEIDILVDSIKRVQKMF